MAFVFYAILIRAVRIKRLIESGAVAGGVVTEKWINQSRKGGGDHWVAYQFDPTGSSLTSSKIRVIPRAYHLCEVGRAISVFYDPANFRRCAPYEICDYEIIS